MKLWLQNHQKRQARQEARRRAWWCCMAGENPAEKSRNMVVSSAAAGYVYSDVSSTQTHTQTHLMNQIQSFEPNAEMFNLTAAGMEMVGFPQKNLNLQQPSDANSVMWKGFFAKHGNQSGPSSSKSTLVVNQSTTTADFYQHEFNKSDFATAISQTTSTSGNLMVAPESAAWQEQGEEEEEEENRLMVDDPSSSSSLRCVFPCEGHERPSQGLSLSLSSANPSSIGLQSFELRHTTHPHNQHHQGHQQDDHHMRFLSPNSNSRDGFFGKSAAGAAAIPIQEQQMMIQQQQEEDGFVGKAVNLNHHHQGNFQLRNSKYLAPAQQLLKEFCNLGTQQIHPPKQKHASNHWDWELPDETGTTSSCSRKSSSLYSLELVEFQKRKSKLLSMLEEVDKRYKHYCDQMKAVVSSFESVAGNGAARVYSALASKAMSRHFRCLRDGIVGQIHGTKKAMGEKDPVAPGATRGETPRLRLLDQALRQQRAFQQMNIMESHPWRPQRGLPERSVSVLRAWLFEHFLHPYPSDVDKHILARQTGLSRSQVSNWFINARVRLWKPMVEEMYLEETKEQDSPDSPTNPEEDGRTNHNIPHQPRMEDQKPTAEQLVRIDSECLSSIIINNNNNPEKNDPKNGKSLQNHHNHNFGRVAEAFGAMELDFSSYNHHTAGAVSFSNDSSGHQNFGGSGGGVSLTLGLQQHGHGHGGSGVSLAFSPASQSSLFYTRDPIEDCQPVQYSILDEDQGHNLPYRNLMGAQLLHDLAG